MDKKDLTEADIRSKFLKPAIERAGWDDIHQIREEVSITDGRIVVRGKLMFRGKSKRADYVLNYLPNRPVAVIEAKDNKHSIGADVQQALNYAEMLNPPFAFSSNGDGFIFHDCTGMTFCDRLETALTQTNASSTKPSTQPFRIRRRRNEL